MASKKTSKKKTATKNKTSTRKKATKKTTSKKKTAKKKTSKKKAVSAAEAASVVKPVQTDPADLLWEEIKNLPINLFAIPAKVSDHVIRVHGVPGLLCVRFKSGAALPALETTLSAITQERLQRTSTGDPVKVQYPMYEMEETDLYVIIKRFVPSDERPELRAKADTFVVMPSGKPY